MASEGLHEPADRMSEATIDMHRALISLIEELEAIDWYHQRIEATDDDTLAAVLTNSRDDEKEHASMTLEWIRRHDPALDEQLRRFLFTSDPLGPTGDGQSSAGGGPSLGMGGLRGAR
jgi:ferritin-like protein